MPRNGWRSAGADSTPSIGTEGWDRLERILERFEDAWRSGARPVLEDFLAQAGPAERDLLLRELVEEDLEYRLQAGEAARVEDYLERYPQLRTDPAVLLDLIRTECRLRRSEPAFDLGEYRRRFPAQGSALEDLLWKLRHQATSAERVADRGGTEAQAAPGSSGRAGLPQLPGHELLEVLGRGGMGVVYKARQLGLNRIVALKMILGGGHTGPAELARFRTEAEAVARLQHPGIVQIHETGMQDGLPYFSQEFVAGGSLDRKLNGRPLPPQHAARLTALLAEAVQAAHDKGILHRDLKPANVFLMPTQDSHGVPLEEGAGQAERYWPKIGDFGLAKKLDEDQELTRTGAVMGTPSFMAPEQAAGQTRQIGPPVDVYALGLSCMSCSRADRRFEQPAPRRRCGRSSAKTPCRLGN